MPPDGLVTLDLPAEHRWLPLLRAVVTSTPPAARLPLDALAELGLVVAEVATGLVELDGADRLRLEIDESDEGLRVVIDCEGAGSDDGWMTEVTAMLLEAVTTRVEIRPNGVSFSPRG